MVSFLINHLNSTLDNVWKSRNRKKETRNDGMSSSQPHRARAPTLGFDWRRHYRAIHSTNNLFFRLSTVLEILHLTFHLRKQNGLILSNTVIPSRLINKNLVFALFFLRPS